MPADNLDPEWADYIPVDDLADYMEPVEFAPVNNALYNYDHLSDTTFDTTLLDNTITVDMPMLPYQLEMMDDTTTKILGMVAGFGSGKTYTVCKKAMQLLSLNPGCDGIITEPNYPLLIQVLLPEMEKALNEAGYEWIFKKTEGIYYVNVNGQTTRIIAKSMENYDRLIGINAAWIIADEFDTTKEHIAYAAFIKLLGRLRAGWVRQFVIVGTPEGFQAMYKIFVTEQRGHLIKARTTQNIFLPPDFVETLYDTYPPNLVEAYINGEFINMHAENVFSYFDREKHHATVTLGKEDKSIWFGGDFNAGGCVTLQAIRQNGKTYIFGEYETKDTFETRDTLQHDYKGCHLYGCFDATGTKKTSNASQSDLEILGEANVSLMMGQSNPHIMDSVLSVNNALIHGDLYIDTNKCPQLTRALEQLAYDEVTQMPEKRTGPGTIDDYTDALRYLMWVVNPVTKISFSSYNGLGQLNKVAA